MAVRILGKNLRVIEQKAKEDRSKNRGQRTVGWRTLTRAAATLALLVTTASQQGMAGEFKAQGWEGKTVKRPTYPAITLSEAYFESSAPGPYDLVFKIEERGMFCIGSMSVTWVMRNRFENRASGEMIAINCENEEDFSTLNGTPVSQDGLGGFVLTCLRKTKEGCTNAILKAGTPFVLMLTKKSR